MTIIPTQPPTPCPPWCDRRHLPTWPVHTADCGDVVIGSAVIAVELYRSDSDAKPAVVNLSTHTDDKSVSYNLDVLQARQMLDALAKALALLSNNAAEDEVLDERFGGAR